MRSLLRHLILVILAAAIAASYPCFTTSAAAAAISPVEGLELVRRGFSGMTDFTAEITQEKQIALLKKPMTSKGQVRFKRPGIFFMEVFAPYPSRLLLNDNVLTMILPAEGIRQKSVLPPEEGLLHWFRLLDKPIDKIPEGMDARAERKNGAITLWITPKDKKGVREIRLTLLEDGRPKGLLVEETNRDRTVITFRNVRKNVGLTMEDFRIE
jgi:outer membrane lipoprotein carrier protein